MPVVQCEGGVPFTEVNRLQLTECVVEYYFADLLASADAGRVIKITEFTYQGKLMNGSVPASGFHDLEFTLHSAASGGSQLGPVVALANVNVNNGVLSARVTRENEKSSSTV